MPGVHCSFLNTYQAALFLPAGLSETAMLSFMAWLPFRCCPYSKYFLLHLAEIVYNAVKSLNRGRSACLFLPQGKQHPEEQLIMDPVIFQSHCDRAGRFNQLPHTRNSQWIPFVSLIIRMNTHRKAHLAPTICHRLQY